MRTVIAVLILLLARAGVASAAPPLHVFSSASISPDAHDVASLESDDLPNAAAPPSAIIVLWSTASGPLHVIDPCGRRKGCRVDAPVWAPHGHQISFVVHDRATGHSALETCDTAKGRTRVLMRFTGELNAPRYAPDGHSIAVLATANAHKEVGATRAGAAPSGAIGVDADVQRIAVVDGRGRMRYASPRDLFVYEYDWLPDGTGFVGSAAHGNGDNNWWVAQLYSFVGGSAVSLYRPALQIASPRVSPDGKSVAFIGGLMSDFGSTGGDVYVVPIAGGSAVDVTPNLAASATSLWWSRSCSCVTFTELTGTSDGIAAVDVDTHAIASYWSDETSISADGFARVSVARDGVTTAVIRQAFERPPEIAVGPIGAWRDLTHANAKQVSAGRARSLTWTDDGRSLAGWLLEPRSFDPSKRYPMIVNVHGGPSAAYESRFVGRGILRDLLAHGYYVFLPNPRGSFGEGEAFTQANVKDFGYGDLRDILSGVDAVERRAPIDDDRLGIMGYSYGGYMTMWAVTQTQRFKAAVAGAGVANWLSYYGENGIDEWMIPFFGASVYDDPDVYARSSPITFIKNVKTPTFAFVGDRDVECPMPQTQEFWHALVTLGVPTSFVVYPGEGHGIRSPAHQRDITERTLSWFGRYLTKNSAQEP